MASDGFVAEDDNKYLVDGSALLSSNIPLGSGPPRREELLAHYPAKFTWKELKTFVNSG